MATALELFGSRGYGAVGVAELAAHAGVQKGSFYHFFPSKEALALAVIDEHWAAQRADWAAALAGSGTGAETFIARLRGVFDYTARYQSSALRGSGSVTGCLFGNLAIEASSTESAMRDRLQAIFEEQVDMIAGHLQGAVDAGEVELDDVRAAAKGIVAQLEGLILFAKLFNDPAQLDLLWGNARSLLGVAA